MRDGMDYVEALDAFLLRLDVRYEIVAFDLRFQDVDEGNLLLLLLLIVCLLDDLGQVLHPLLFRLLHLALQELLALIHQDVPGRPDLVHPLGQIPPLPRLLFLEGGAVLLRPQLLGFVLLEGFARLGQTPPRR